MEGKLFGKRVDGSDDGISWLLDIEKIQYAFTHDGRQFIHAGWKDEEWYWPEHGIFVRMPDTVYKVDAAALVQLLAAVTSDFVKTRAGAVANLKQVQAVKTERPLQLGFLAAGPGAVPQGEWVFASFDRDPALRRRLGLLRRSPPEVPETLPSETETGSPPAWTGFELQNDGVEAAPPGGQAPDSGSTEGGGDEIGGEGTLGAGVPASEGDEEEGRMLGSSYVWHRADPERGWFQRDLPVGGVSIVTEGGALDLVDGEVAGARARVMPLERRAVLLACPGGSRIVVNGEPLLGVRLLSERDEILVDGERFYFGSQRAKEPRLFGEGENADRCVRCSTRLRVRDEVIECGICSGVYHSGLTADGEQLGCWEYDPSCQVCGHDRAEINWSPQDFGDA